MENPSPGQSVLWSCGESQIGRWGMRSWTMVALGTGNGWFKSNNSSGSKPTNTIFRSQLDASPFSWPAFLFFGSQILLDLNQRLWGRPEAWIRHLISRLAESKKIYIELHWYIWYIYMDRYANTPNKKKSQNPLFHFLFGFFCGLIETLWTWWWLTTCRYLADGHCEINNWIVGFKLEQMGYRLNMFCVFVASSLKWPTPCHGC